MARARNAEEDLKHALKLVYPLLRLLGAWPVPVTSSSLSKILNWCVIFVSYFLQLLVAIPSMLYVFAKERNGRRQMKLLLPHLNGLAQIIKYTILLYQTNELRKALDEIKKDWLNATIEDRQIFREKSKIGHKVVLGIAITIYSGGLCYRTILPLLRGRIDLPNNTTVRILPCPSYFVFINEQLTPNFEIIFVLQVLGGFFNYTILSASMGVFSLLSLHLSGLLRILLNKMIELTNQSDTSEEAVQRKIVDIVEQRTKIKRFFENVEQITPYLCFIEIIDDTCVACMLGYCIIVEWENHNAVAIIIYFVLQTSCTLTIFAMCFIGQLLIDENNRVREMSVTLNWYRFPTKQARCLILVIVISNFPMILTAGKVVNISLSTFTDVMKTSMGYLNMLRTVV